jgi:hypothetical protein
MLDPGTSCPGCHGSTNYLQLSQQWLRCDLYVICPLLVPGAACRSAVSPISTLTVTDRPTGNCPLLVKRGLLITAASRPSSPPSENQLLGYHETPTIFSSVTVKLRPTLQCAAVEFSAAITLAAISRPSSPQIKVSCPWCHETPVVSPARPVVAPGRLPPDIARYWISAALSSGSVSTFVAAVREPAAPGCAAGSTVSPLTRQWLRPFYSNCLLFRSGTAARSGNVSASSCRRE